MNMRWPATRRTGARALACALVCALECVQAAAQSPSAPGASTTQAATQPSRPTGAQAVGQAATTRQSALATAHYLEEEWRLQGRAQPYKALGDLTKDGRWRIEADGLAQPYQTRLLVRRPADPARFNGTVLIEWLNTSLGFDLDGAWMIHRDEILREGYAWVGVSAEAASSQSLHEADPRRYADIHVAHNGLSYDIYTQAAQSLREAARHWGRASGPPVRALALGYSQSGSYLITYINAVQPLTRAFDGFYTMSTAAVGMPLNDDGGRIFNTAYRSDMNAPVMQVSTEMEVMVGWQLSKTPDTDRLRHWEMAGATHLDRYMQQALLEAGNLSDKLSLPHCLKPSNVLPSRVFNHAALHALNQWVRHGTPPPTAPRMARNGLGFIRHDDDGNALGGLRLPDLDAPLAEYGMYSNLPTRDIGLWTFYACMAGGSANPLPDTRIRALYPSAEAYLSAYRGAADKLLAQGFLRPADHAWLIAQAQAQAQAHRLP